MNFEKSENISAATRCEKLLSPDVAISKSAEIKKKIDILKSVENKNTEDLDLEERDSLNSILGKNWNEDPILWLKLDNLEREKYQCDTAQLDGAKAVEISYPKGAFYKSSEFGSEMKEKEENIKALYHDLGKSIDQAVEGLLADYNLTAGDKVSLAPDSAHAVYWSSVEVIDSENLKAIEMEFDYGKINFILSKFGQDKWNVSLKVSDAYLVPQQFLERQKAVLREIREYIESKADQVLG
jgi:hypothetical protein